MKGEAKVKAEDKTAKVEESEKKEDEEVEKKGKLERTDVSDRKRRAPKTYEEMLLRSRLRLRGDRLVWASIGHER